MSFPIPKFECRPPATTYIVTENVLLGIQFHNNNESLQEQMSLKAQIHQTDTKEHVPTDTIVVSPHVSCVLVNSRTGTHRKDFSRRPSSTYALRMREW